MAVFIKQR
jgi:hypothetical protein